MAKVLTQTNTRKGSQSNNQLDECIKFQMKIIRQSENNFKVRML
jgi:hypothetical protein